MYDDFGGSMRRSRFIYDPIVKGYDTLFFKTISGSDPTVVSTKLRITNASIASYLQFSESFVGLAINFPAPGAGINRQWGLNNPSSSLGGAYFKLAETTFTSETVDEDGVSVSTTLTWDAGYTTTETLFEIAQRANQVIFRINGVTVAIHAAKCTLPTAVVINTDTAENVDVGYIRLKETAYLAT